MRKFITIIALAFSMQANAAFINLDTETVGDELSVTLSIDNTANNISEIHFDFDYDITQLAFTDFTFNFAESLVDDFLSVGFDTFGTVFVDAYWSDMFFCPSNSA